MLDEMSYDTRKPVIGVDTNRPVQAQKKARILKFWILVEEGLYYLVAVTLQKLLINDKIAQIN